MSTGESFSSRGKAPQVALIAGPTASGKSDLAVRLAHALGAAGREAVVINADSAQVYADLAVLSARPDEAEMGGVEHRLYGAWDGAQACSAADWAGAARAEIAAVHGRGAVPILVGGTGLYIRTLLDGIAPVPAIDPAVRAAVRAMETGAAHAELALADPARAALLHPADTARVLRALEVVRSTGRTLQDWQAERSGGIAADIALHPAILLPDRQWLYDRCDRRFAQMLETGAVEEVSALMARDLPADSPVLRAIGVPDIIAYLRGEIALDEARERGAQATRNYVKRQLTWLRHQFAPEWPRGESQPYDLELMFDGLFH
jgi:tRNA dimethylallyltransferase